MIEVLSKISNWKFILPTFVVFALFSFYLFPSYQSQMAEATGEPVASLDTRFSYSVEEVRGAFDKLGATGREIYREVVGVIDMIYPLVYGLLFVLVLAWALRNLITRRTSWLLLALLPLMGVAFDYLENFNTLKLLDQYPNLSSESVGWGESMTQLKHVTGLVSVSLAVVLAFVLVIRKALLKSAPDFQR